MKEFQKHMTIKVLLRNCLFKRNLQLYIKQGINYKNVKVLPVEIYSWLPRKHLNWCSSCAALDPSGSPRDRWNPYTDL